MKHAMIPAMLAAVVVPTVAAAQMPPGHADPVGSYATMSARSRKIAHCVVNRAGTASRGIVLSQTAAAGERYRTGIEQALRGCMSAKDRSITLNAFQLRGDLADDMLTASGGALLNETRAAAPVPAHRLIIAPGGEGNEAVIGCAVAADPDDAANLIGAAAATPAEMAAFQKLIPQIQACVPESYELHMKPFEVRRYVAIALYRQASAMREEKN